MASLLILRPNGLADIVIDLTLIGDAGNAADISGFGAVGYDYYIGTYEVTVAQYAEFLNAVAKSDPYGLYDESMGNGGGVSIPIITRTGTDGDYAYTAVSGRENQPVRYVDFYDALRFSNWLNNGQGSGDTETGSYDLTLGLWVERGTNATWVLPSRDEWYKAAYYDPVTDTYRSYPTESGVAPQEPIDETTPREANFGSDPYWHGSTIFTAIGETTGRTAFGVCDMGGNVTEWNESLVDPVQGPQRVTRGGSFVDEHADALASSKEVGYLPTVDGDGIGFRVARVIPEPGTLILFVLGLLSLGLRRGRASRK